MLEENELFDQLVEILKERLSHSLTTDTTDNYELSTEYMHKFHTVIEKWQSKYPQHEKAMVLPEVILHNFLTAFVDTLEKVHAETNTVLSNEIWRTLKDKLNG